LRIAVAWRKPMPDSTDMDGTSVVRAPGIRRRPAT